MYYAKWFFIVFLFIFINACGVYKSPHQNEFANKVDQNILLNAKRIIYVNTNGNDKAKGSKSSPLASIQKALDIALPGDVIKVGSGTYTENIKLKSSVSLVGSGADITSLVSNDGIAITADNIFDVTIEGFTLDGKDSAQYGLYADCRKARDNLRRNTVIQPPTMIVFKNNTVKNFLVGCVYAIANITIDNNSILNSVGNGIELIESFSKIEKNKINGVKGGIICIGGASTIDENVIEDVKEDGIYCRDLSWAKIRNNNIIGASRQGISSERMAAVIQGNHISACISSGIRCYGNSSPKIRLNTIMKNQSYGILIDSSSNPDIGTKSDIGNNLIYDNGNFDIYSESPKAIMAVGNWWGDSPPKSEKINGKIDFGSSLQIPAPPSGSEFSLDDLKNEANMLEVIAEKVKTAWTTKLEEMKKDYNEVKDFETGNGTESLKATAWRKFLDTYNEDNPYSQEDDIMLLEAKRQLEQNTIIIGKDGAEMVLIHAGEFQMGSDDEKPVHTVYLDAFHIDKYEVTNAQYKKFMDAKGYKAPSYWNDSNYNDPKQPVVGVSWNDAKAYADWAGKRLPTEAEWEKAARGSLSGKKYPWGDTLTHDNANYSGTDGKDQWEYTSPVGSFAPNGYGLYDMAGNVWEWCADWYDSTYYASSLKSNPKGPSSGKLRVLRGGSWNDGYDLGGERPLHVATRITDPLYLSACVGFRCVQ